jgi:hypothetical protein
LAARHVERAAAAGRAIGPRTVTLSFGAILGRINSCEAAEQIYRALTILPCHPYHRG